MEDADREMNLRFEGRCEECGESIPARARAIYNSERRKVRHIACSVGTPERLDTGRAGGSAMREYERRTAKDRGKVEAHKARIHDKFGNGFLGKVAEMIAVDDSPKVSTKVWAQGAKGERMVAARLDSLGEVGVIALHDRLVPGTKANIDHLVITPWGVWIVDAKRYVNKRVSNDLVGGFFGFGGRARLLVGGRDRTKLVEGVEWQISRVKETLANAATDPKSETELGMVPVRGCLCFVDGDWPLIGGAFDIRGVQVCWPKRLTKTLLRTEEPSVDVDGLARLLATRFPPA